MTNLEIKHAFQKMNNLDDLVHLINTNIPIFFEEDIKFSKFRITKHDLLKWSNEKDSWYHEFKIRKKKGFRTINAPRSPFKEILQVINHILQSSYTFHKASFGYVPTKSIADNAKPHVNKNYIFSLDLENFFPSIGFHRIKKVLGLKPFELKDDKEQLALVLANLCTYQRKLPQGAPTSPVISNMICWRLDNKMYSLARKYHVKYTRYADDITFSCNKNVFKTEGDFYKEVFRIIEEEEKFRINQNKVYLQKNNFRQQVTGLVVNKKVNVPRRYIRNIRTMLHNWEQKGLSEAQMLFVKAEKRSSKLFRKVLKGRIYYIGNIRGKDDIIFQNLLNRFKKLQNKENLYNKDKVIQNVKVKDFVQFLRLFNRSEGLKYLTHDFDIPNQLFSYEKILNKAKKEFKEYTKQHQISPNIYRLFYEFIFNPNPSWSLNNNSYGWSTEQVRNWCQDNKGLHPISNQEFRAKMIHKMTSLLEVKRGDFPKMIENAILYSLKDKSKEFSISFDKKLEKLKLVTYTEHLDIAFKQLFFQILLDSQRKDNGRSKKVSINIEKKNTREYTIQQIEVLHEDMKIKTKADINFFFRRYLNAVSKLLYGLCEWSIEAEFEDGYYRLNILCDNIKPFKEKISKQEVKGIKYIFTFYS